MSELIKAPKVCIDGDAIRRIREEKKLTQFYVAKVVGVTTDTVSRWENNRYPSIRRDNALLLSEALETDISDILLNGTGEPEAPAVKNPSKNLFKNLLLIIFISSVSVAAYFYLFQGQPASFEFSATRVLPSFAVSDGSIPVRIRLQASGEMKGMILREHFPRGWKLLQASPPPSSLDNIEGVARWIIKPDDRPPVISYLVRVPDNVDTDLTYLFSGEVIINPSGRGVTFSVDGGQHVDIGPFHWADTNGDFVIDDSETLTASDSVDEMEPLHLNWDLIEKIWDAGKYSWDAGKKMFLPVRETISNP